ELDALFRRDGGVEAVAETGRLEPSPGARVEEDDASVVRDQIVAIATKHRVRDEGSVQAMERLERALVVERLAERDVSGGELGVGAIGARGGELGRAGP